MNNKLLKSLCTNRFLIELYETPQGTYILSHDTNDGEIVHSAPITDYKLADYMFELLIRELEGM